MPDPLKQHETVGGFDHVWRRWVAEGRALGLTMPSHPRGRDYQLVDELERLALDAVPDLVERTRFEAPEAFVRLVGLALRRYATQHREDAKRSPWKLGFVVSAWPELTKGAVPQAKPQEPPASRPAPTPTAPKPSEGTRETAEPPRVASPASLSASLPSLLPQTQANPASRPKAAQTAA